MDMLCKNVYHAVVEVCRVYSIAQVIWGALVHCMELTSTTSYVYTGILKILHIGLLLTSTLPQSHISSPSLIPLPHTGSPTVVAGALLRQRPRLNSMRPLSKLCLLQLLQEVGTGEERLLAMIHLPVASEQPQSPVIGYKREPVDFLGNVSTSICTHN